MKLDFFVAGTPVTQGSKLASVNPHTGRAVLRKVNGSRLDHWRTAIATEARQRSAWFGTEAPVAVTLHFCLPKPASEPKRRRTWPIRARSGDVDKLARAVLDAITNVLIADDSQVVSLTVSKDWAEPPTLPVGLLIEIETVAP